MARKGRRLCIWVPEEDCWLFESLEDLQRSFESEGIPVTKSELVRNILKKRLSGCNESKKETNIGTEEG